MEEKNNSKKAAPVEKKIAAVKTVEKAEVNKTAASKPAANKTAASKPAANKTAASKPAAKKTNAAKPAVKKTAGANNSENKPANPDLKKTGKKKISKKKKEALRRKRMRRRMIRLGMLGGILVIAIVLVVMFAASNARIAGKFYSVSTQRIDLRSSGVNDTKGIARLTKLEEALLGGNALTDVSGLDSLTECGYIDLTGNPVTAESYAYLRSALPECLILCEAEDYTVTHMALGGHTLPGLQTLMRVFESHKALKEVDLRGTGLSQADADMLCEQFANINFIYTADGDADTMVLRFNSTQDAVQVLQRAGGAKHVTLTGCAFTPDEYRALTQQFSEMTIDCLISLYTKTYPISAEQIDLTGCTTDAALVENLKLFPKLNKLTVSEAAPSTIAAVKEALALNVDYIYNGAKIDPELTQIDLRGAAGMTAADLECLIGMMPNLNTVMMDEPDAQLMMVIKAYKQNIRFSYDVTAFGRVFSAENVSIDLQDAVNDKNVDELTALLAKLPRLEKADMYESKLSKENMDKLFDSYPDIFFGWTFKMCEGKYVVRTDATAFSTQIGLPMNYYTEEHLEQLRYCKNLQALDLGHNNISDLSFLYDFPKLKVLILADNKISDTTPIASLTELEYLEIFMNNAIRDFTPLTKPPLKHLNICFCGDKDNKVTADMFMNMTTLKRFWASRTYFDKAEGQRLAKALPDCTVSVTYGESTGDGWRRGEPYKTLVRMFETGVYEPLP